LSADKSFIEQIDVAGPGFINFRVADTYVRAQLRTILAHGTSFGKSTIGGGKKTQVEFVSANPTGPLSVGHGRQAAIGDTIANLLLWTGHDVTREYYYNNAGKQMRVLAESTYARYLQLFDSSVSMEENAYQGAYLTEIAQKLRDQRGDSLRSMELESALAACKEFAEVELFEQIKKVLQRMGVRHDVFYNEDSLYASGKIDEVVEEFRKLNLVYDKDGAVWLKTSALGLEQDRVIIKSTGEPTYRLPDIAYHREKFRRGFEFVVDVFGADHIDTIPDVLAGIKAFGFDTENVKVVIHQFVTLLRDGQQVKMSKRSANYVTLEELLDDVGVDAARFFFLMRATSSHLEFDLDLAKEQSEKNPVYYLQYAHARIESILRFAVTQNLLTENEDWSNTDFSPLTSPVEMGLMKLLLEFPGSVASTAVSFEPHRLANYLHEVAAAFHRFYHDQRVVGEEVALAKARLGLCTATRTVLANGFAILGISTPERM
jgi:arginyl-tRNA synthetase